jgi:hypothetical protein
MRTEGLLAFIAAFRLGPRLRQHLAWPLVGLPVLAWVAAHSGPNCGEVVVHVSGGDVEVTLGGQTFRMEEQRFDPIVCALAPGRHRLVMKRHGRILYQESFEVRPGESLVLTAWDPEQPDPYAGTRSRAEGDGRSVRHY